MKKLLSLGVVFLPWRAKRWMLRRVWKYDVSDSARIGLSYVFPKHLVMKDGAFIGHLNVAIHLNRLECGEHSAIDRGNWISGHPIEGPHFKHRPDRDPSLLLSAHSAITKSHIVDCTDRIRIGSFTTIAGYHSQLITHGINVKENRQDCSPIDIGDYCLVGTRATILGGAALPHRSVLGAGSVLVKRLVDECTLYAGQPAAPVKALAPDSRYFDRVQGVVI